MAHQAGAYPSFCSVKWLGVFLLLSGGMLIHQRCRRIAGETSKRRGCINSKNANRTLCTNIQWKHTTRWLVRFLRSSWFSCHVTFPWFHYKGPRGGGVLPYIGDIGMCGPKGYGFSAVLVINRVSILADLGHKLDMVFVLLPWYGYGFKKKPLFHHYGKENQQKPFTNYVYGNLTFVWTGELIIMQVWKRILM